MSKQAVETFKRLLSETSLENDHLYEQNGKTQNLASQGHFYVFCDKRQQRLHLVICQKCNKYKNGICKYKPKLQKLLEKKP